MEVWKDIEGTNGTHSISNYGRVKSNGYYAKIGKGKRFIKPKIRIPQNNGTGYHFLFLKKGMKPATIHRLVATHFIPNPENKPFVNHKNGIKTDNRVENLEWVTRQENENHAFSTGLKNSTGSSNTMAKLNEKKVKEILNLKGNQPSEIVAEIYGVHRATITRIWQRVIWSHV